MSVDTYADLIEGFRKGDRKALAKVITLVESTHEATKKSVNDLMAALLSAPRATIRVAVSGPPGVGKSTFINALGKKIVERGFLLAVLPVDPTSELTSGSILADKTRMKDLLQNDHVYIRPSPSKGALGGMSFATHDVLSVVEAFGFNFVLVETVGVGQSETLARSLADHFVVLVQPGAGDQLQAMKKGILERADFILVSKADGDQEMLAKKTLSSLKVLSPHGISGEPVLAAISAHTDRGLDTFLERLLARQKMLEDTGALLRERASRLVDLFTQNFAQTLAQKLKSEPALHARCRSMVEEITRTNGAMGPLVERLVTNVIATLLS